jgi:Luciferase-like monooxygenase
LSAYARAEALMQIGLFDHVEHGKRPLATLFDERLAFAKAADEAGIYCLHVAEHHATPLNMVPVPGVYLGAVARATKRMRLGPLVYLPPALFAAALGRGDLHPRPSQPWEIGNRGRTRRVAIRTQVSQDRPRRITRYLH